MVEDGLVEVTNLNNFANENGDTVTDEPTIINMEQYRAHQYGDGRLHQCSSVGN